MFFVKFYSNVVGYQDMETYHYSTTINTCICVLSTSITKYLSFQELSTCVYHTKNTYFTFDKVI